MVQAVTPPKFIPDSAPDFIPDEPQESYVPDGNEVSARPQGPLQTPIDWLQDVRGDIKHGTGVTLPGRVLRGLGARGTDTGVPEAVGDLMPGGGTMQGVSKMAEGGLNILQGHPIKGVNKAVQGAGQALAPAVAATNPEFLPEAIEYGAIGAGTERAARGLGFSEDTSETIGTVVTGLLGLSKAKSQSTDAVANKLKFASNAPVEAIKSTIGDISKAIATTEKPDSVGGFLDAVKTAKQTLNDEYGNALGPHANDQIMPEEISNRILKLITPNMENTARGRSETAAIKNAAVEYQKPWSLGALDQERMDANSRLHSYEKKGLADQYAASGSQVGTAIDKAIADGVRESVYPMMDRLSGKPAGYFRGLKERVGNLLQIESDTHDQIEKLENLTAKVKGAPPLSRARVRGNVGEGGAPRFWISNALAAVHAPDEMGAANSAVRSAFKKSGSIDPLLYGLPIKALLGGEVTPPKKKDLPEVP